MKNTRILRPKIIHIGKCGGTTVTKEFRRCGIKYDYTQLTPVVYNPAREYILCIRNPIQRFLSAYYWRKYLVCDSGIQKNRFPGEDENIKQGYYTKGYIHHITENIDYYLGDFDCPKEKIKVICTETLAEDMKRLFGIDVQANKKKNERPTQLTRTEHRKLKKHLKKDYDCIEKLKERLTKKQYDILCK